MKFKNYLETITGVEIYPLTSLLIFFLFFTALAIWAIRANKSYINELKNMPLVKADDTNQ
ncbi:MAG: CcoQ/FixQ family Cbb3-type cytochrome c oxidase assembly chaperone [Sphingobacteriales bacterium]|nr:MAG: CcoQ/FixQ family Cbb3-type cytochrome c oxidase assembly chaperone [Sphingobacteriales bacterium]